MHQDDRVIRRERRLLVLLAVISLGLVGGALYLQFVKGEDPCPLCIIQRYFFVLIAVFATAISIDPYNTDGSAQSMGTHQQLRLPPCTFQQVTKVPCPSCGMTTSFSLLMHGANRAEPRFR